MKQQTAVEWLWNLSQTKELQASDFEQALAMERDQHGQTWDAAIHAHDARGHVYARSMCDFDDYWGDRLGSCGDLAGLCGAKTRQM